MPKRKQMSFRLADADTGKHAKECVVRVENSTLLVSVKGYNLNFALVGLQVYNGRLKLLAWPDREDDTPTTVDLEGTADKRGLDEDGFRCPYCRKRNTAELDDQIECYDCGKLFLPRLKG